MGKGLIAVNQNVHGVTQNGRAGMIGKASSFSACSTLCVGLLTLLPLSPNLQTREVSDVFPGTEEAAGETQPGWGVQWVGWSSYRGGAVNEGRATGVEQRG